MRANDIGFLPAGQLHVGGGPFREVLRMNGTEQRPPELRQLLRYLRECQLVLPEDTSMANLVSRLLTACMTRCGVLEDRDQIREAQEPGGGYGSAPIGLSLAEREQLRKRVDALENQAVRLSQHEGGNLDPVVMKEVRRLREIIARPAREEIAAGNAWAADYRRRRGIPAKKGA